MWFDKYVKKGGSMPTTSICGYSTHVDFDPMGELTEAQVDASWDWYVAEVNNALPDFAEWSPATSSIIVPVDKVHELDKFFDEYSWDDLLNDVFEKYVKNCDDIIGEAD